MMLKHCSCGFTISVPPLSLQEEFEGVVARVVVEPGRDIESLPLALLVPFATLRGCSARDFVRGRMGESALQALGRACRDLEGLFESLLAESFGGT
jgi:hypothetical protein